MDDDKIRELKKRIDNSEYSYKRAYKKPKKRRKKINIINILFITFLFYVLFTVIQQEQMMRSLEKVMEEKTKEKINLEQEVSSLREDEAKIDDPEAFLELIEEIARNEYKMVKPYETIYIDKNKNKNKFIKGIVDED